MREEGGRGRDVDDSDRKRCFKSWVISIELIHRNPDIFIAKNVHIYQSSV